MEWARSIGIAGSSERGPFGNPKKTILIMSLFFLKWSGLNRKDFLDVPDIYDVKLFLYLYL